MRRVLKTVTTTKKNKKGCGKMYCAIEGCGKIDESHTAYCVKHGRSTHQICGENGLCFECEKRNRNNTK